MKAISEQNPWGFLLCLGVKDIENRTWKLPEKYKGERVLIHASADRKLDLSALTKEQYNRASLILTHRNKIPVIPCSQWPRSAIIGSVRFIDCVINHPSIWAEKTDRIVLNESWPNGRPSCAGQKGDTYNWIATDAVLFEKPILNVKGKLGFWDYPMTEEEYNNLARIGV